MRINATQVIAGFPAGQVRRLMRATIGREISVPWVTKILQCPEPVAERVLAELEREGLVEHVNGHREPSLRGSALAQATAAKPLLRRTADRLVAEVVSRAALANLDDDYAFLVRRLVVFGSYLDRGERLNDVDVACQLVPRWSGEQQEEAETLSRGLQAGRFRNVAEWAIWPKLEVLRFLKSGSRGLSIQELDYWIIQQPKHLIVFEERTCRKGGMREIQW